MGNLTQTFDTAGAVQQAVPLQGITAGTMVLTLEGELPVQFLAPGVTIPIGLGIGRLVFTALNVLAGVVLVLLTAVSLRAKAAGLRVEENAIPALARVLARLDA